MSSNFNNAKIINVYYNKGDRKPYDVNGKPIAYIGEEAIGATEATTIRFYLGEDLDSSTAVIVTKRPDGERRLDLCEKFGTGVNSYYQVTLNAWYGAVKGKATLAFKVYNGEVEFDDEETPTEIISVEGRIVVSDIFNLEIAYAPEADLIVPADDTPDYVEWFAALSTKLDKAQSITVTGALPTLTGDVYDDRYFYVENEGVGRLYYINGSTAIEVVWQVGTLRLTPTGNGEVTADTGKLSWNQPNGTVNVGLYNDVNIGVGEDVIYYVKATGAITKGDVIQYAGFQGDHALAKRAVQSEVNANPKLIMGIAKQNIANGEFGYVAHFGKLEGVDTKSQAVNSFVWFDSAGSTAGNWTTTQPTAPNAKILLAVIIKAETNVNANNGVLLVRPTIEPKVSELQDINITSIANGQVLRWNATNSRWENTGALTTAESNITNLQGRMTTEEANVDNLQGRMTSAEGDIDDIESGATVVPRALGDQNGNTINTTYLTQSSASATYIPLSQKAQANGVATLGADGRVIASQIPGVVTSIEEYDTLEDFPETGFLTVVYLAMDTGLTYLWSGTQYVVISSSLALGESSTTAYRGDRGKIAYDYSQVGHLPLAGGNITGNLNASGDVGIGTTSPNHPLTIQANASASSINIIGRETGNLSYISFSNNANNALQSVIGNANGSFVIDTNTAERVRVTSAGDVGIGTPSPSSKLDVNGMLTLPSTSEFSNLRFNLTSGQSASRKWTVGNDFITFGTFSISTETALNNNTYTSRFFINPDGNVGIGTTSPDKKLTVSGDARLVGVGSTLFFDTTGSNNSAWLKTSADFNLELKNNRGEQNSVLITNNNIELKIGATPQLLINPSGNVGIGTTSPTAKLEVANSSNTETSIRIFTSGVHSTYIGNKASDTNLYISNTTSGGVLGDFGKSIILGSNGNVGIGTSPTTMFHIAKSSALGGSSDYPNVRLDNDNANGYTGMYFYQGSTQKAGFELKNDIGALQIFTGTSERMRVRSDGDITITGTILQDAWSAPTLENSWVNFGGSLQVIQYMKDKFGFVHIRGNIKNGTKDARIFTLPSGFRPPSALVTTAYRDPYETAQMEIATDGSVYLNFPTGANTILVSILTSFKVD
jgi:hypothetical protein